MSLSTERSLRRAAALLLALLCLLSLAACGSREEMAAPELLEPRGVALDVAPVSRGSIQRTVIYEGVVLPGVRELAFASSGRVTELLVCPGSRVKAGDVIARLDVARTADALAAAESRLAYAEENEAILEREQEIRIELSKLDLQDLKNNGTVTELIDALSTNVVFREIDRLTEQVRPEVARDTKYSNRSVESWEKSIQTLKNFLISYDWPQHNVDAICSQLYVDAGERAKYFS